MTSQDVDHVSKAKMLLNGVQTVVKFLLSLKLQNSCVSCTQKLIDSHKNFPPCFLVVGWINLGGPNEMTRKSHCGKKALEVHLDCAAAGSL